MILPRYLLRQFFPPFFFGLALFSGVLLMDKLFDIVDLLVNKGVSLSVSLRIFLYFLPTVLTLTVPMAVLLACLLTFGRLSEENEITAMRASGLSFTQILWPPLAIALVLCAVLAPFNTLVAPRAINAFRSLYHEIVTTDPLIKIEPRQFINLRDFRLYVDKAAPDRQSLQDVQVYQITTDFWQRIYARRGFAKVETNRLFLRLEDGQLERAPRGRSQDMMHMQFMEYTLSVPFGGPESSRDQSWREMTMTQLHTEIQTRKKLGVPAGPVRAEWNLRFAVAFSPLALAMLGIPLGITLQRGGRGVGFGASLAVVFAYYLLLILGLNLAEKDTLPALPSLWMANVFTMAVGVFLYRRRVLKS
ncbi:MAG TPA: LptF/LptG family permease [Elusimicrobiota bacterium]|nr:LptF/LptG family permease [Elusimicrobiota bacterium]